MKDPKLVPKFCMDLVTELWANGLKVYNTISVSTSTHLSKCEFCRMRLGNYARLHPTNKVVKSLVK